MDRADAIIANLTPFRRSERRRGHVYELGYMLGKGGKLCLGYSNTPAAYIDKVAIGVDVRADGSAFRDPDEWRSRTSGFQTIS